MIQALLVDDEPKNSEILSEILRRYCPSVSVAGICADIMEAEKMLSEVQPQLIFLDVQMPGGSGFDLLDKIRHQRIEVIFVTAHNDFMLQAIRYSALDYILKPIAIPEIIDAVSRAAERLAGKQMMQQLELLLSNMQKAAPDQKIAIPHMEGYLFVQISDIMRMEARGAYTEIFGNNGKSWLVSKNIGEYEQILPDALFIRVHHAHLVNLQYVKAYHKGRGGYIEMENGSTIEVSVRRKDAFLDRFR
ncbi:LytR/AlgR family response regulator transcription factor [Edaphocola aurantiacus]|uniref:LytR/AlgR family response regulator transcription factor n=1 Tax=Edaphocola aurantiacus TaxID=2601682 RepID=UPI001C945B21|nr:LytTR family DNA-binding domain-containing protein [Edaphocola aurantiacus]